MGWVARVYTSLQQREQEVCTSKIRYQVKEFSILFMRKCKTLGSLNSVLSCVPQLVVVQSFSHVWLFVTPWIAACQASLSFTISWSLLKLMSIESVTPANYLVLYCPLLFLPSVFPSIGFFFQWVSSSHQVAQLLLLLLSHFSHVQLSATPCMAAHQATLSLGFSRQEHWSGLPFPSAMHESEKWKWSRSVLSDSQQPHGLQPTRLLCP